MSIPLTARWVAICLASTSIPCRGIQRSVEEVRQDPWSSSVSGSSSANDDSRSITFPKPSSNTAAPSARHQEDIKMMMGVNRNANGDEWVLMSSLVVNSLACVACMIMFCALCRIYPAVYRRVGEDGVVRHDDSPSGVWNKIAYYTHWWQEVRDQTDEEALERAGLDGLMFLEYLNLIKNIMVLLFPTLLCVLCPMHYYWGMNTPEIDVLSRFGINNLPQGSPCFWVHSFFVWYVVTVVVLFLLEGQRRFVKLRYNYLSNMPTPQALTVMVEHIPPEFRTDQRLRAFFQKMFGPESVQSAFVIRYAEGLYELQQQMNSVKDELDEVMLEEKKEETAAKSRLQALMDAAAAVDREETAQKAVQVQKDLDKVMADLEKQRLDLESQLHTMEEQFCTEAARIRSEAAAEEERKRRKEDPVAPKERSQSWRPAFRSKKTEAEIVVPVDDETNEDSSNFSGSGFVTFSSRKWRRTALKEQYADRSDVFVVSEAPEPQDVYYKNLAMSRLKQDALDVWGKIWMVIIFFSWCPIVVAIAGLTSIHTLMEIWPAFSRLLVNKPEVKMAVEGVFSSLVLTLFMSLLPTLFFTIFRNLFAHKSGAMTQLFMQEWLYAFNIIFVLLITAVGRSVLQTATIILDLGPREVFKLLALSMPTSSHFYLEYIILGWFSVAFQQLRLTNLLKFIGYNAFYSIEEAKKKSEPEDPASYGMGARFANVSCMAAIVFSFSTCSPPMCVLGLIYFYIAHISFTYLLCFAETKKPDLGGMFWVQAMEHTFIGLVIFVVLMVGILEERAGSPKEGFVALSSIGLIYWGRLQLHKFRWHDRPLPEVVKDDEDPKHSHSHGEYKQPLEGYKEQGRGGVAVAASKTVGFGLVSGLTAGVMAS